MIVKRRLNEEEGGWLSQAPDLGSDVGPIDCLKMSTMIKNVSRSVYSNVSLTKICIYYAKEEEKQQIVF